MKQPLSYKKRGILLVLLLLLVLGISLLALWLLPETKKNTGSPVVTITQAGNLLYEIPLETITVPYKLTIEGENGLSNVIYITNESVSVESATCPDKLCVKSGTLRAGSLLPIVCLPNKLVIELHTQSFSQDTMDSYTY